jgi:hypothetical protein
MGFGVAACYAVRFLPYLPIGMIVAWDEWDPGDIHIVPPAVATVAAVGLAFGVLWPWATRVIPTHPSIAQSAALGPGAALSVLAAHGYGPGTDVFANLSWGGYLEWRGYRPWIDTRDNFWSHQHDDLTAYFLAATGAVNPDHVVRRSGDQIALLKPHGPLVWGLQADHWIAIWHDADAVILIAPGTLWSVPVRHPVPILPSRLRT